MMGLSAHTCQTENSNDEEVEIKQVVFPQTSRYTTVKGIVENQPSRSCHTKDSVCFIKDDTKCLVFLSIVVKGAIQMHTLLIFQLSIYNGSLRYCVLTVRWTDERTDSRGFRWHPLSTEPY